MNESNGDEIEKLHEIQFINGSKYEGTWNAIDKTGIGRYVTPYNVVLEGEFRDGMLHGQGSMYWPRGQRMDGIWNRGKLEQKRYTFADGLSYQEDGWDYCKFPDRRFYNCIVNGLRPARKTLKTNDDIHKMIPPFCYDTIDGIFDPQSNCITSYRNYNNILKIPTKAESIWIKKHCRKALSEPTGHQEWLRDYWQWSAAHFATLQVSPENETENWWRRLTELPRHSPPDVMDKIQLH